MSKNLKRVLIEMVGASMIYEVLLMVVAGFVAKPLGYTVSSLELGIVVGILVMIFMMVDMARTTEDALASKNEKYAMRTTMLHSFVRKAVFVVVVFIFWKSKYVNVLGIVFSIFGIKAGAYLQPLIHKLMK